MILPFRDGKASEGLGLDSRGDGLALICCGMEAMSGEMNGFGDAWQGKDRQGICLDKQRCGDEEKWIAVEMHSPDKQG